jgi:O-antigen/teichoic acid export membrane protein
MITFVMGMRIEAIPIASMVTEILILLFIIKPIRSMITIRFELVSRRILKYIGSYFLPGIVSNISTILLTLSDRYIISLYGTMSEVGIYNQIYNFAQVSIVALISIFFAVINPEFFNILEQKPDKIKDILVKYHLTYILFILPMVAYISIFAEPITNVLFGEEFRVGYTMIPFIAFSYYINGLINFRDTKLKFENRYRIVIIGFILSTVLNIALNFIFLPIYGYKTAAVTTLIAYGFLYLYYQYYDRIHLFENARFRNTLLIICSILVVQTVTHYLIKNVIKPEDNLLNNILEGMAYVSVYAFLIVMLFRRTMKQLMTKENI